MDNQDFSESPLEKRSPLKRFFLVALPVVMLLLGGGIALVYYLGELRLRDAAEKASIEKLRYEDALDERALALQRSDVRLFAVPLAWAVRRELMQQNYGQIDEYFNELIARKQFGVLMLLDPDGTVRVSTDRKFLGRAFSGLYPGINAASEEIVSYSLSEGSSLFLVPVMGLNTRIGTIAFVYSFEQLSRP